ncbi:pantetheine-phosphate adenylyltransferase [bacterium]|nr:pantetheine-phosphate adenylyltransferase [bacterium]
MTKVAVYPGSFDPFTKGHEDLIRRAAESFDNLIVGVAVNPRKSTLFTPDERVEMIRETLADLPVRVEAFEGLLVDFLRERKASVVIRGLRAVGDFEYEFQMALTNRMLLAGVDTFFLMASEKYIFLSSSMVKEVAMLGGNVREMVPAPVLKALKKKAGHLRKIHLTG